MHTFYHVTYHKNYNCFPELEVGQQINAGVSDNPFYNYFHNINENIPVGTPDGIQNVHYSVNLKHLADGTGVKSYPNPTVLLPHLYDRFTDLATLNRELVLENIRLAHYPNMPSRLKCLWVTLTQEECEVWKNHLTSCQEMKIITLTSDVLPVKVDSKLIPLEHDSLTEKERKAHAYWSGKESDNPMIEYLFAGTAEVIAVNNVNLDPELSAILNHR